MPMHMPISWDIAQPGTGSLCVFGGWGWWERLLHPPKTNREPVPDQISQLCIFATSRNFRFVNQHKAAMHLQRLKILVLYFNNNIQYYFFAFRMHPSKFQSAIWFCRIYLKSLSTPCRTPLISFCNLEISFSAVSRSLAKQYTFLFRSSTSALRVVLNMICRKIKHRHKLLNAYI